MKNRINIGTASIVLIFIILCLSVFALLSLSDAKSALLFARRRADSVTAYYQADRTGQSFIRDLKAATGTSKNTEQALEQASASLPEGAAAATEDSGLIVCEIPMNAGQALRMELQPEAWSVLSYYVYNQETYAIDDRIPVWVENEN